MQKNSYPTYSFDDFTIDLARCCLLRGKQQVKLRPKPFEVLKYLVENRGRLVNKEELIQAIWRDSFVTDDSLVQCLVEVRRALGDDSQQYIKTVPRRGYIFEAQVREAWEGNSRGAREGESGRVGEGESARTGEQGSGGGREREKAHEGGRTGERESGGRGEREKAHEGGRTGERESGGGGEGERAKGSELSPTPLHFPSPPFPLSPSPALPLSRSPTLPLSPSPALSRSPAWPTSQKVLLTALVVLGIAFLSLLPWRLHSVSRKSIGVLPLKNLSAENTNEYFSDGITDDIITQLSKIGDLKVVSRTSAMRYKNTDKSLRDIATELNVATILEGSVRRVGSRVRISVQLIDANTDEHIWAETYDRQLEDVFEIQSDVANQVATALKAQFSAVEKERAGKKPTINLAAYDRYLRGRAFYYLYSEPDNERAIEFFQEALQLDANYALAYAGLSDAYSQRAGLFGFQPGWIDTAIGVAEKAISLDPNLAEGQKALGLAVMHKGWYRKALKAFQKAFELNPNFEPAVSNIGVTNLILGKFDEALPWMKRSLALDPATNGHQPSEVGTVYLFLADDAKAEEWFSKAFEVQRDLDHAHLGFTWLRLVQGKYREALQQSDKILPYSPDYVYGLQTGGTAKILLGDYSGAKKYFERLIAIRPTGRGWMPPVSYLTSSGYVLWKTGQKEEARKMFDQSLQLDQTDLQQGNESFAVRYDIAAINAAQGNKAEAYKWLQQAVEAGFRNYRFSLIDPLLENLHHDERFKQMMTEVKKQVDEMRKRAEGG